MLKGKYLIIPNPDDIFTENILTVCYNYAEKYKYEMIRFKKYTGKRNLFFDDIVNEFENKILKQPEISTYIFYAGNELRIIDYFIYNKFINFLKLIIIRNNDNICLFLTNKNNLVDIRFKKMPIFGL